VCGYINIGDAEQESAHVSAAIHIAVCNSITIMRGNYFQLFNAYASVFGITCYPQSANGCINSIIIIIEIV